MVSTRSCSDVAMSTVSVPIRTGQGPPAAHQSPQSLFLLDLPVELLDKIFSYVGYKAVAQIRTVSRQMNQVCSLVLNSTFQRLQNQIMIRFQSIKAKMPRRESSRRHHPLSCECDIIETVHMRLSLLQMTLGRHIERKHCCFFPGGILDEVLQILNHVRVLGPGNLGRPYKVTDELFDLSTMAMEHFKEHIEPGLPDLTYFSKSFLDFGSGSSQSFLVTSSPSPSSSRDGSYARVQPSPPHMVLRKGIRKIRQGMRKYNNQLTVLRNDLRSCKKKATEQSKLIADQQKLIADQQKQALDYATRLDENDKKNEEISRKFSNILQELNKCKTELLYWRASGSSPMACNSCGQTLVSSTVAASSSSSIRPAALDVLAELEEEVNLETEAPEPQLPTRAVAAPAKRKISPAINITGDQGNRSPSGREEDPLNSKLPKKIRRTVKGSNGTTSSKL